MGIKDSDELEDIEKWIKLKKTACLTLRKHIDLFKKKFFHDIIVNWLKIENIFLQIIDNLYNLW